MTFWWNSVFCLCIIAAAVVTSESQNYCNDLVTTPGYTLPHGDIYVEYGNPLEIYCVLHKGFVWTSDSRSSSSLSFTRESVPVDKEMVHIVNSSTIKLYVPKPVPWVGNYYCLLDDGSLVCANFVAIGTKPKDVTDFKCISYNWESLKCSWTAPRNYVATSYKLTYRISDKVTQGYTCPKPPIPDRHGRMNCYWDETTTPQYRMGHERYFFQLTMINRFGENSMSTVFDHFQNVLPAPPEHLHVVNKTFESIYLEWKIPSRIEYLPSGLLHRVLYQCEYGPKHWTLAAILHEQQEKTNFNLTGLYHANALCQIKVSLKSATALEDDESLWSASTSIRVHLGSAIPSSPPKTTPGCFETKPSANMTVYIYWQQIPKELQNGPKFHYNISIDGKPHIRPETITVTYAKFTNLSTSESYKFKIWSKNIDGPSKKASVVYIPEEYCLPEKPSDFTKTDYGCGKYELNWQPPKNTAVTSYTLFWCNDIRDWPYKCNGFLDWTIVPGTETSKEIHVTGKDIYQFAISANNNKYSSGMQWADCTILYSRHTAARMKNVQINNVGSTHIDVGWKLQCSDQIGSVGGYIVYYCPVGSGSSGQDCKESEESVTFCGGRSLIHGVITGLKSSTTYKLAVSVLSKKNEESLKSDALLTTTLEEALSPAHKSTDELIVT